MALLFFSGSEKIAQGGGRFPFSKNNLYLCTCRSFLAAFEADGKAAERFNEAIRSMKSESMEITYKDIHEFRKEDLEELFLSVEWSSGQYPDKLVVAMRNFSTVYSAWDGDKLVGMVCAMDDGIMTAYLHYMLVRPEYHQQGIGHRLLEMMKKHYESYLRIALIAYNKELGFYESCGFKRAEEASPMFITSLWT